MKNPLIFLSLVIVLALGGGQAAGQFVWTKDIHNPVLSGGGVGSWNNFVFNPCVLYNSDSTRYEMWYMASPTDQIPYSMGFAVSMDGVSWTAHPSAVMSPDAGSWDQYNIIWGSVIRENKQYKMWYTGSASSTTPSYIGYATSPDGILWTKHVGNPIMGPGTASWELGGPLQCFVMPVPGGYKMWYSGGTATYDNVRIGYATSADGILWRRDTVNNPVLNVGAQGQWDTKAVGWPTVLYSRNMYYMWYQSAFFYNACTKAGVATSSDGITNWTKYNGNPVFTTTPGSWDQTWAEFATVVLRGDTLHAWYDGSNNVNPLRIGHATSPLVAASVESGIIIPVSYLLAQNYPNPFNPSTAIRYELPHASRVSLKVYNTLGQEVSTLVNENKSAGVYTLQFDAGNLASGVYFYRIQAGDFVATKRLLLLK
jgi:hypothetical protein